MIAPNSKRGTNLPIDPKEEFKARDRRLIKFVIESGFNETEAARRLKCTPQNVSIRMRRLEKRVGFARLMDYCELADIQLIGTLREGLKATRPVSCNVYVKDKTTGKDIGEMVEAGEATKDFIDVEDYAVRHRYLDTALKVKRHLGTDVNVNVDNSKHLNILNVNLEEVDSKDLIDVIFGRGESAG